MISTDSSAREELPAPHFEDGRPMIIAGLRECFTSSTLEGIPALWQRLIATGKVLSRVSAIDYAVVFLLPEGCEYVAGLEVASAGGLPEGFSCAQIPRRRYAIFSHDGHVSALGKTFDTILRVWLPQSKLRIDTAADGRMYALERYGEGFDPCAGTGDIQVWVPVTDDLSATSISY
jgi:AraC family transcriptional regulator